VVNVDRVRLLRKSPQQISAIQIQPDDYLDHELAKDFDKSTKNQFFTAKNNSNQRIYCP
jgi:hypothetical protein